jgi:hypothetical protein
VFENRVLRRIFGPIRDEVTGGWRKLHDDEFHTSYSSPNMRVVRVIKSRRMRWAGHVAHGRYKKWIQNFWLEYVKRGDHSKVLGVHGRTVYPIKIDLKEIGFGSVD